jgi:hypothetical protein
MSIREGLADITNFDFNRVVDAIIKELPETIPDLVWYKDEYDMIYSKNYYMISHPEGYSLYCNHAGLGCEYTKSEAKEVANAHHRKLIMSEFTREGT